jgi:cytochrome c biogenesis protein
MREKEISADSSNKLWNFFASVRLTVIILLSLAATSVIGTVIPQNESPAAYFRQYGEFFYRLFNALDIFDMYHSWWFQFLLLMLTLNIVVCSINRLSATWKIVFVKNPPFNLSRFKSLSDKEEFTDNRSPEQLKKRYEAFFSKGFGYRTVEETDKGFCIFAEKGRWTRLGVYFVHLSVILMVIGGLLGSIFGFEGAVNIPENEVVNSIQLRKTGKTEKLDFGIRLEDFNVSFYDSGTPREYRSTLSILEQGEAVLKKDIIVNNPLRYKGINIFQASYGMLPPKEVTLIFKNAETGKEFEKNTAFGKEFDIPEGGGKFVLNNFKGSFNFMGHNLGMTFVGTLTPAAGDSVEVFLPVQFPNFDKMRRGELTVSVADYQHRYYTGLQVTKDPGVFVVYMGFVVMIIGCFITFFMSHQRVCVEVTRSEDRSKVMVAGTTNKNKMGMHTKTKNISQSLIGM